MIAAPITRRGYPMTDGLFPHDDAWDASLAQARTALRQWRASHPQATFNEIEAAVDAEMQRVRAQLVTEAAGRGAEPATPIARDLSALRAAVARAGKAHPDGDGGGGSGGDAQACISGLSRLWYGAFPPSMNNSDSCRASLLPD